MRQKRPQFPVGTVIVKEKLARVDSNSPELMTVMVRHAKGYNPENGDWEYLVVGGKGTRIDAQGKLATCQSCHSRAPAEDNVFRSYYLPEKVRAALK